MKLGAQGSLPRAGSELRSWLDQLETSEKGCVSGVQGGGREGLVP